MKKVQFIKEDLAFEADLLILCDEHLEERLDQKLKGILAHNREKGLRRITTNGSYPVPQIVMAHANEPLTPHITETKVAVAGACQERVFQLLLKRPDLELTVLCQNPSEREQAFKRDAHLLAAIKRAKALIAAPANLLPPVAFAKKCQELKGIEVNVLDEKALKQIGASALLAVGQGSAHPPRLVILEYKGSNDKPLALVGKGICYDSGGINLKTNYLTEMKWDKAGAGVVFGVLDACARLQLPLHVIGILPLAENMPDGAAFKPGDVISTLGGKEVEIVDTDCEGRLVLADGLAYAQMFSPQEIIDLGTLTLETFGALGGEYAGLFCSNETLLQNLIQAGKEAGEQLWPLPLGSAFADQLKSGVADLKNAGIAGFGGSSVAAEFLRVFVNPQIPYAHIDISGVSWKEREVTGYGISLLVKYMENLVNS